jgi:hypothetical protein
MARGGPRQPARPAAVSTPGSGARTDGGAGSKSQPLRVASGGAYGQRQAAEAQQGAAPMAAGGPPGGASGGSAPGGAGGGAPPLDIFGPTGRPNEPVTAGLDNQGLINPDDPDMMLKAIYQAFPHPSLARLMPEA